MPESPNKRKPRARRTVPATGPAAVGAKACGHDRASELAIISSVQDALASRLGMQAIYDIVGDKIREIFAADTTFIVYHDLEHHSLFAPYYIDRGVRPAVPAEWTHGRPYGKGLTETIIESGKPLLLRTVAEQEAHGAFHIASPGSIQDLNRTFLGVPLFRDGRACGVVSVQSYREAAYDENDARLLSALASSMSVALENARLFDETQRLLKETEARAAELATINSIQQGIAAKLDFQGIVDLVGDKLREVFATGDMAIHLKGREPGQVVTMYVYEHGVRLNQSPRTPDPDKPLWKALFAGRECVVNSAAEAAQWQLVAVPGTDAAICAAHVPIVGPQGYLGHLVLENHERENAFGPGEVKLLQTLASSLAVALENARLFDETQRRARESAALSDVGRDLSSTLDLATVMDRIAAHAKELLIAENSAIFLPEGNGDRFRAIVALGEIAEELKATVIEPGRGIIGTCCRAAGPSSSTTPRPIRAPSGWRAPNSAATSA